MNYTPARGTVSSWGDGYGNRVDRFLAGTAYLDGSRPSLIMARGYYTRAVVAAWDFRNGTLTSRWTYDSGTGNDDNGTLLWRSGLGHGDALHVGELIPSRAGIEVYRPSESTTQPTDAMLDGRTGAVIWSHPACGCDNGRAVAGDVSAGSAGAEAWSSSVSGLSDTSGANIGPAATGRRTRASSSVTA